MKNILKTSAAVSVLGVGAGLLGLALLAILTQTGVWSDYTTASPLILSVVILASAVGACLGVLLLTLLVLRFLRAAAARRTRRERAYTNGYRRVLSELDWDAERLYHARSARSRYAARSAARQAAPSQSKITPAPFSPAQDSPDA